MRIAPGMSGVCGLSVVDVATIAEAAAVAETMFRDDCAGVVHEVGGFAPAALIEITGRAVVVARVRNVAAIRGAADVARRVAMGDEVGDQRPEPLCKVACHHYRSGCGGHRNHSAASARQGRMGYASMVNLRVDVPVGVAMMLVMGGLGLGGAQGKECCRYQQSHTQYLFSCCSLDALPEELFLSAARCRAALAGLPFQVADFRIRDADAPGRTNAETEMRQLQGSSQSCSNRSGFR